MYTIEKNRKGEYYVAERKFRNLFFYPEYIQANIHGKEDFITFTVSKGELHQIKPYKSQEEAEEAINFLKERKKNEPLRIVLFDFT